MARLSRAKIDELTVAFAKRVIRRARGNLTRSKRVATKDLWNSLGYRLENEKLQFFMADYGPFQDQGVTGHGRATYKATNPRSVARSLAGYKFTKGPVGPDADRSFRKWIATRNIAVRDARGRIVPRATASFLLRRSVGRFGIEPSRFFSEAWERFFPEYEKALNSLVTQIVNDSLDDMIEDNLPRCKV